MFDDPNHPKIMKDIESVSLAECEQAFDKLFELSPEYWSSIQDTVVRSGSTENFMKFHFPKWQPVHFRPDQIEDATRAVQYLLMDTEDRQQELREQIAELEATNAAGHRGKLAANKSLLRMYEKQPGKILIVEPEIEPAPAEAEPSVPL